VANQMVRNHLINILQNLRSQEDKVNRLQPNFKVAKTTYKL
jgi:hypothetical protein